MRFLLSIELGVTFFSFVGSSETIDHAHLVEILTNYGTMGKRLSKQEASQMITEVN
jgi:hypothetical protein